MLKKNPWNCFFHKKKVDELQMRSLELQELIKIKTKFLDEIGVVNHDERDASKSPEITGAKTLGELLRIHKEVWNAGFQDKHLGPTRHGMFRCDNIPEMTEDDVFLGKLYGLPILPISQWEKYKSYGKSLGKSGIYDYLTEYEIVLRQYKRHLSNIIRNLAGNYAEELKAMKENGY